MKRLLLAGSCLVAVTLAGCSAGQDQTDGGAETASVTAEAAAAAMTATEKHQPSEAAVSMYVRRLNAILAKTDESMSMGEAMSLAASMCEFLDMGNSPYDAVQIFTSSGVPDDAATEIVPLAIGAACTQHFPG